MTASLTSLFGSGPKALSLLHTLEPLDAPSISRMTIRRPPPPQRPFPYQPSLLPPGFSLIHLVATGVSCFLGSGLLTLAVYLSCQHCQRQSQESTLVHPATPNHLHYKGGGPPKNEKYTPMEFKVRACMWNKAQGEQDFGPGSMLGISGWGSSGPVEEPCINFP